MVPNRMDPQFYKLMAEALVTVEDALERVRAARAPRRMELRALSEAIANYVRLCDEWRKVTERKN